MRRKNKRWGCAAIAAGLIIILALVLPEKIWWLLLALALLSLGVWYMKNC